MERVYEFAGQEIWRVSACGSGILDDLRFDDLIKSGSAGRSPDRFFFMEYRVSDHFVEMVLNFK